MSHWINWNDEKPITGSQFWIKNELNEVVADRAYISLEDDAVWLATDGEDELYTGQISEWAYELGD